jgi:predicted ester cyclase
MPDEPIAAITTSTQLTREQLAEIFERRETAYAHLDVRALIADYSGAAVVESPLGGTQQGPAAIEAVLKELFEAFPDVKIRTSQLVIDGNHVAQLVSFEGTDLGRLLGMEPTGKSFRLRAALFYEFNGRLIVRERRVYDFTGLLVQIGVMKAKPT